MSKREAQAPIRINKMLEDAGWRFFPTAEGGKANIICEHRTTRRAMGPSANLGDDFEKAPDGFVDYLLLNDQDRPLAVVEAKRENIHPLDGKEQARDYAHSRITDITDAGTLAVEEPKFAEMTSDAEAYRVQPGDIFIARTGASFGNCLLIEEPIDAIFASYLIRLRFDGSILPKFFWAFTKSDDYWQQARKLATGAGQPQFNANAICKIEAPIPPVEIQRTMIAEISREQATLAGVAKLKAKHEARIRARLAAVWGEAPGTEIASSPNINPSATAEAEAA